MPSEIGQFVDVLFHHRIKACRLVPMRLTTTAWRITVRPVASGFVLLKSPIATRGRQFVAGFDATVFCLRR